MSMPKYSPKYEKPLLTTALKPIADLVKGVHAACKAVKQIGARDFDNLVDSIMQHGLIRPKARSAVRQASQARSDFRNVKAMDEDLKRGSSATT